MSTFFVPEQDKMYHSIDEKLAGMKDLSNNAFIFKVYQRLRKHNEDAYEPEIISIGPYHHGKENLNKMEKYKLKYVLGILERRGEESVKGYIAELKKVEKQTRNCYAEDLSSWSQDAFLEMMLLDGCFIIEFLREYRIIKNTEDWIAHPVFSMFVIIRRDLMLFENQLPFFILQLLFDMSRIEGQEEDNLIRLAVDCLYDFIPANKLGQPPDCNISPPEDGVFHLLRLMYDSCWCSPFERLVSLKVEGHAGICRKLFERRERITDQRHIDFIKNASTLTNKYGIEFQTANGSTSWLDIKYEKGILQIPTFEVGGITESILRNLIAYEQIMSDIVGNSMNFVTDYAAFLERLIDSPEDVQILSHEKIIRNCLGNEEEISNIFNKISNGIFLFPHKFTYRKLFEDVNKDCSARNTWCPDLKKKYFDNPWSFISFVAATILLLLTVAQTVFSAIGL